MRSDAETKPADQDARELELELCCATCRRPVTMTETLIITPGALFHPVECRGEGAP